MAPLRCGPSQGHRAATAGRKAACNTPKAPPQPPWCAQAQARCPPPPARSAYCGYVWCTPQLTRSGDAFALLREKWRRCAPQAAAAAATAGSRRQPPGPPRLLPGILGRHLSWDQPPSQSTGDLLDGPLAEPTPGAWPPGVQPDHLSEMTPLRCNPTERHSAATAGHRAAFNTVKGPLTTRPGAGLVLALPPLAATLAHHHHPTAALSGR